MENLDKKTCDSCGGNCGCGGMHMHGCHGGKHHLMKVILKIVILILVFWCGLKLGEMTGFIKAEYGHGMMTRSDFGMMRGGYSNGVIAPGAGTATPVTPAQ